MLIGHFSLKERIICRIGFYGFMAIGTYGMYKQSPLWAMIYVLVALLGFTAVILPSLCVHCPYPSKHNTCLFLPPALLNRFYPYKKPPMSLFKKIATFTVFAIFLIMPQPWLFNDLPMLGLFWLLCLPLLAVFPAYYCKRCRHIECPLNKVSRPRG